MVGLYEPYIEVCRRLGELSPCGASPQKSVLVNSGAEAVENAVKIARAATGRPGVIVFDNAFHGRALLTMTMTAKEELQARLRAVRPGRLPRAGAVPVPRRQLRGRAGRGRIASLPSMRSAAWCLRRFGAGRLRRHAGGLPGQGARAHPQARRPLVDDEIQSGIGRTGRVWAIEHFGVEPDLVVSGKSLGGGLPLAGVTGPAKIVDSVEPGGLGGTFGGNPLACTAALGRTGGGLLRRAFARAPRRSAAASAHGSTSWPPRTSTPARCAASGRCSLWSSFGPRDEGAGSRSRQGDHGRGPRARPRPAVVRDLGNVIRVLVPLVISDEELDKGLDLLAESLAAAEIG